VRCIPKGRGEWRIQGQVGRNIRRIILNNYAKLSLRKMIGGFLFSNHRNTPVYLVPVSFYA
jgi:hypothetical protein